MYRIVDGNQPAEEATRDEYRLGLSYVGSTHMDSEAEFAFLFFYGL